MWQKLETSVASAQEPARLLGAFAERMALGKCKCKPSKCSQLKKQAAVDIAALRTEVYSSDSEPEDYCVCTDACDTTLCNCIAIKQ